MPPFKGNKHVIDQTVAFQNSSYSSDSQGLRIKLVLETDSFIDWFICLFIVRTYAHMEVREQLPGVGFPHFGFWGIESDHQSWQQASLPAELSHQPQERGSLET